MPSERGAASADSARPRASFTVAACSARLRRPIARRAQLTPFLTKFRSSSAARSARGRKRQERLVAALLVVEREAGHEGEAGPLLELLALSRPRPRPSRTRAACGRTGTKQIVSTMPQLSKSRHQRSIWAGVTRAGSSTKAASMRASYQPVSQRASGQLVVLPEPSGDPLHGGHRHAPRLSSRRSRSGSPCPRALSCCPGVRGPRARHEPRWRARPSFSPSSSTSSAFSTWRPFSGLISSVGAAVVKRVRLAP